MFIKQKIKLVMWGIRALIKFLLDEIKRGTFFNNISGIGKMEFPEDISWAELLEEKAKKHPKRVFLIFGDKTYTYAEMDKNANRVANYLLKLGGRRGEGIAMIMGNSPRFLDLFFGVQKIGMYAVPVNTSLRGDSMLYILNHSDAEIVVIDEEYLEFFNKISDRLENIKIIIVNPSDIKEKQKTDSGIPSFSEAYHEHSTRPDIGYNKDDICFIIYTSGTTGPPKGVVYRYRKTTVKVVSLPAFLLFRKSDILYTSLPLFHGNALMLTVTIAMHIGARVVLEKKFSASRFWDDIRKHNITVFNTIGAMIPILMKQPENPADIQNNVRFTLSAACPADMWEKFEKRFGIKIYEGYAAVDGGGKSILNLGTCPVGSIGRPPSKIKYRIVDENMNDVEDGTPGELIFEVGDKKVSSIEYFKNEKASNEKFRDGYLYTGDLIRRDGNGYLYFVGRNTESMRISGENVSAYEVEHAILKHPDVLETAVYAVPSELAEDEIMASISLVEGHSLKEQELVDFLKDDLARFAIPRYVRIVSEFPKTETERIKKKELESPGVVPGTYDAKMARYIQ